MSKFVGIALRYIVAHQHSLISVAIRVLGVLLAFLVSYFIANRMGANASGQYALIVQTAVLLSVVLAGGVDLGIVRNFAVAKELGKKISRQSAIQLLRRTSLLAVITAIPGAWIGLQLLDVEFSREMVIVASVTFVAMVYVRSLMLVFCAFLRAQSRYTAAQAIEVLVIPSVIILSIVLGLSNSLDTTLLATTFGAVVMSVIGISLCLSVTSTQADAYSVPPRQVMKTARPLWGVALASNFGDWYGLAVVAALLSVHDTGVFRIASQIGLALSIISVGVLNVFAPQISAAYDLKNYPRIAHLVRSSSLLSILVVLPAALFILIFAAPIMEFIGPDFVDGVLLVQILVAGQAVFVCTGTSGIALAMTGHEKVNLTLNLWCLAAAVVLTPLAAFFGGLNWVGLAVCCVMIARNLTAMAALKHYLGVNVISGHYTPLPGHPASEHSTQA